MSSKFIYVLVVDDSNMFREILRKIIEAQPDLAVIGFGKNGQEAIQKTRNLKPDVIIMDVRMPVMDGIEAVEHIMDAHPTPILICSASVSDKDVDIAMKAIKMGALDVIEKPNCFAPNLMSQFSSTLAEKIRFLSQIKVLRHRAKSRPPRSDHFAERFLSPGVKAIGLGASTGGPRAISHLLSCLDSSFPACILLVQHISKNFCDGFVKWLATETTMRVRTARKGMEIEKGLVLVAPAGKHMVLRTQCVDLLDSPPINGCCPSVDILFKSIAKWQEDKAVGILLTGMGKDGAEGARAIVDMNGHVIVQNEETSTVFGMPKAAIEINAASSVLPLSEIPGALLRLLTGCPPT